MNINLIELLSRIDEIEKTTTLASYKRLVGFYLFSTKNKKLRPNHDVRYLIWNMSAIVTCPYRTAMCEKACYAIKAERAYPTVKTQRARNYKISLMRELFRRLAIHEIELRLKTKSFQNAKKIFVRVHESGDFYSAEYLADWLHIMRKFENERKIIFAFYTKSFDLFLGVDLPENAVPTASIWADTLPAEIKKAVSLGWHIYSADTAERIAERKKNGEKIHICRCADCATCAYCYGKGNHGKRTECVIH